VLWIVLGMIWITMLIVDPPRTAIITIAVALVLLAGRQLWAWYERRDEGGPW
jgi:hypothetical protein